MMRARAILAVFVMAFCAMAAHSAFAETHVLSVDLADDSVDITTGFNGANLVLFGVRNKGGDVAVVLHGPKEDFVVRQKQQVAGAWVNRHSVKFEDVPVFYDVALSAPEEKLLPPKDLKELGIGLTSLTFPPEEKELSEEERSIFQKALIRNKQAESLFPSAAREVQYISDNFFKVVMHVPANVPVGQYVIETFLIRNQKIVDRRLINVNVGQVGFSAAVYRFAQSYAFVYALVTVVFAVWAGWFSNAVRKRK